jgi:hypothetical protein
MNHGINESEFAVYAFANAHCTIIVAIPHHPQRAVPTFCATLCSIVQHIT